MKTWFKNVKVWAIGLVSVVVVLWLVWFFWLSAVSDGYRDGYIQKVSHKGRIWKSWEGELAVAGIARGGESKQGQVSGSVWAFTCDGTDIAKEMESIDGETLVRLYYYEYGYVPPWKGSTTYIVYKVERVKK